MNGYKEDAGKYTTPSLVLKLGNSLKNVPKKVQGGICSKRVNFCMKSVIEIVVWRTEKLTSVPVLAYPDFTEPFIVESDASFRGFGAVFSQERGVFSYASCGLRPVERNDANYSLTSLTQAKPGLNEVLLYLRP